MESTVTRISVSDEIRAWAKRVREQAAQKALERLPSGGDEDLRRAYERGYLFGSLRNLEDGVIYADADVA